MWFAVFRRTDIFRLIVSDKFNKNKTKVDIKIIVL